MKFKLTKMEKQWILYDVGNSAFVMVIATIVPLYFNYLAEQGGLSSVDYLAFWGYGVSAATLVVALIGPALGAIADTKGYKGKIFAALVLLGSIGCISLGFTHHWLVFLILFVMARCGFSASLIFYDSMLTDVTTEDRLDHVSSQGYAWGYIGSCIPFILCLGVVLGAEPLGLTMERAMAIAFLIVAVWWIVMTLPLLKNYKQKYYVETNAHVVADSFKRLGALFKNVRKQKKIFLFLLAFFFYIDGVYTIIDMATAYGSALGLDSTGLLLALLVTQLVAFPFVILFGRLAAKYKGEILIAICICAYVGIAFYAMFLQTQTQFWIMAVLVGMFQGGIQALSRSYYTKIIPPQQSGEYFGLMDICGKGAAFMGTALVSLVSQITGDINKGVGMITILFVFGLIFFRLAVRVQDKEGV